MLDASGQPMTLRGLNLSLDEVYDSIATGGLSDIARAGDDLFGSSVSARAAKRFLVFRDSTAWLEYQAEFGKGTIFDWVVGSIEAFARDVGTIEVLGPFPKATLEFMKSLIDEAAARGAISKTGKAAARASGKIAGRPRFRHARQATLSQRNLRLGHACGMLGSSDRGGVEGGGFL